ncbi:MAG: hypothetical protein IJC63_05355, partial [Myxococcaceae bacterium]|nr:hypothetical protein [Myxococcaceae bacterium]
VQDLLQSFVHRDLLMAAMAAVSGVTALQRLQKKGPSPTAAAFGASIPKPPTPEHVKSRAKSAFHRSNADGFSELFRPCPERVLGLGRARHCIGAAVGTN